MNKCPISYESCGDMRYSLKGLHQFSPHLNDLSILNYTAQELRREATFRATKMSIQGVQAKLSLRLSTQKQLFEIVDMNGTFILKPQSDMYEQLPENEDLTMKMAQIFGINVPSHGLIYGKDDELNYIIKRFDRYGKSKKYHVEDFAQLTQNTRETKYKSSIEKLIPVIENYCTFPMLEKLKLFRRVLFCFVTGNEDMHLKNFSLIIKDKKVELSPAYDLLNTSIAVKNPQEELALPLAGKRNRINSDVLFKYFASERLGLSEKSIQKEQENLDKKKKIMSELIDISFLTKALKKDYHDLMNERIARLTHS
jgi:serine/threonine-protein kinase HipA